MAGQCYFIVNNGISSTIVLFIVYIWLYRTRHEPIHQTQSGTKIHRCLGGNRLEFAGVAFRRIRARIVGQSHSLIYNLF